MIDDLHWAGAADAGAAAPPGPLGPAADALLVVGTFRDTGDEITDPLASCLADLRRTETASRLRLRRSRPRRRSSSFVDRRRRPRARRRPARAGGDPGRPQRRQRLLRRRAVAARRSASGVVARLGDRWAVGAAAGVGVPDSVREVVANRLGRLSPGARRGARARRRRRSAGRAAGAGRRPSTCRRRRSAPALDELVEAKLLIEVGDGRCPATSSPTPSCATPSSRPSPRRPGPASTSAWARPSRRCTRPTGGRCWPQLARHFAAAAAFGGAAKAGLPPAGGGPGHAVGGLRRGDQPPRRSPSRARAAGLGRAGRHPPRPGRGAGAQRAPREDTEHFGEAFRAARELGPRAARPPRPRPASTSRCSSRATRRSGRGDRVGGARPAR